MEQQQNALVKTQSAQGIETTNNRNSEAITKTKREIDKPQIIQIKDTRPAQYQTLKSQGIKPQPIVLPNAPSMLTATICALISICFLVAASMFSIGLNSYANSVDRYNQKPTRINYQ